MKSSVTALEPRPQAAARRRSRRRVRGLQHFPCRKTHPEDATAICRRTILPAKLREEIRLFATIPGETTIHAPEEEERLRKGGG